MILTKNNSSLIDERKICMRVLIWIPRITIEAPFMQDRLNFHISPLSSYFATTAISIEIYRISVKYWATYSDTYNT